MGWTLPRVWSVGEIITKAIMDLHIKDNLRYLKGLDGVPTVESGLIIDNTGGDEYLKLPLLTTAEAGTVLAAEGKVAFDETTHQVKIHNGIAVKAVISEADVDDTPVNGADTVPVSSNWAYDFQQKLTTAGDLPYATAAGVWDRLGMGTAGQYLRTNAGADAPEWTTAVFPQYGILIWTGTIANIPSGFVICDGNNSSPNLLAKFLEGVATAATNPGTTGGSLTHTHTDGSPNNQNGGEGGGDGRNETAAGSSLPPFYDVAFIMKT